MRVDTERKPSPQLLTETMAHLGCAAEETVMVGDSEVDLAAAAAAGIGCIAVTWGCRSAAELERAGATCRVSDCAELLRLLTNSESVL